jgi:hypothetical protein
LGGLSAGTAAFAGRYLFMSMIARWTGAALTLALVLNGTSLTQAQTAGPKSCADTSSSKQDLSDKLSQTNGVICPPSNVDPAMKTPAPDTGKMPVIPPPGSPGGNPNVQPK